ncbi:hypothetical protein Ae263Ps1_6268c [Pseudonocardia sp. Ae263_Ps1]|nr:hypothetical protein Ae263Ps1_6268c [Pseudonocardia sp. Ae263_Ps1]OLL89253.1 hypothetical protein Ae356Ps1_6172 [Pseudonocardia sp. Ae356_Ps1]
MGWRCPDRLSRGSGPIDLVSAVWGQHDSRDLGSFTIDHGLAGEPLPRNDGDLGGTLHVGGHGQLVVLDQDRAHAGLQRLLLEDDADGPARPHHRREHSAGDRDRAGGDGEPCPGAPSSRRRQIQPAISGDARGRQLRLAHPLRSGTRGSPPRSRGRANLGRRAAAAPAARRHSTRRDQPITLTAHTLASPRKRLPDQRSRIAPPTSDVIHEGEDPCPRPIVNLQYPSPSRTSPDDWIIYSSLSGTPMELPIPPTRSCGGSTLTERRPAGSESPP